MVKVSPSILSADFSRLGEQIKLVEKYADMLHLDVMDGHFVPNITFGSLIIESVNRVTDLPIEAHLMIESPASYIQEFANAGADVITVHIEADKHIHRTLCKIKDLGKKAGVSLNPSTPASEIEYVLEEVDMVLVMTVNPGFGGQKFIDSMLPKIRKLKDLIREGNLKAEIEADGGINSETAKKAVAAGADMLVAGSYVYGSKNPAAAIQSLKKI